VAATGETAKFSVKLDDQVSGSANAAADSLDSLRRRVAEGTDRLKDMAGSLRRLRGSTEEVKAAKDELKAKLNAERDAISAAQLAILKAGSSYEQLTAQSKKLAQEQEKLAKEQRGATAGLKSATSSAASLKGEVGELNAKAGETPGYMSLAAAGVAALATAAIALVTTLAGAAVAFGKFVLASANAARTASLFREAATGSASNAYALGTQIDALAKKVPTAKSALNDLAISLAKSGIQGQTLVDTFNAVGQASAAMGDDAGAKLRELIERGKLTQRFAVNPLELQGTGLQVDDLAKNLAASMRVGVGEARRALLEGRVKLADGAKALREVVESKFGDLNLRRMLDLNVLSEKFKETLSSLTSGVKLDPLLAGLKKLSELFGEGTVTGATIKQIVTLLGTGMVKAIAFLLPLAGKFMQGLVVGTLDLLIGFFKLKNAISQAFGSNDTLKGIDLMSLAFSAGKIAVMGLAAAVTVVAGVVAVGAAQIAAIAGAVWALRKPFEWLTERLLTTDWKGLGAAIVDGIIGGLTAGVGRLEAAVKGLADKVKSTFTGKLEIHSPSKVFERYGENTAEGYAGGVERGAREADAAIAAMAGTKPSSSGRGAGAPAAFSVNPVFHIQVTAGAGADGEAIAKAMQPSLRAAVTQLMEELAAELGAPRTVSTGPEVPA